MYKVCLTFLIIFSCFTAFSQTGQVDSRITEVYADHISQMRPEQLDWLNNCLQRTQVLNSSQLSGTEQNMKLLSTVHLQSKFPQPAPASPFNPSSFNPLMYSFDYFDKNDQYFKVDGTDYVIKIAGKDN